MVSHSGKLMAALFMSALAVLAFSMVFYAHSPLSSVLPQTGKRVSPIHASGIELQENLSATSVAPGNSITVRVDIFNSMFLANTLSAEHEYPAINATHPFTMGGCSDMPFGVMIASGMYSLNNFTQSEPLELIQPNATYSCPLAYNAGEYVFMPHSSVAQVYSMTFESSYIGKVPMKGAITLHGYWTGNYTDEDVFHTFSPGTYTVVSADEWGQVQLSHFNVE